MIRAFPLARLLALLIPAALLAGAWGFQLVGGLPPCEMCHWQRWPHYTALIVALLALAASGQPVLSRLLVVLAALLILGSGAVAIFHMGVEHQWWPGPAHCTGGGFGGADPLRALLAARIVRCDVAPWSLFGISLAGWNAIFSILGGVAILSLCLKTRPR